MKPRSNTGPRHAPGGSRGPDGGHGRSDDRGPARGPSRPRHDDRPPPRMREREHGDQDFGPPPGRRRPLAHGPGEISLHGPPELATPLADAIAGAGSLDGDVLTHGFHVWPARMHRAIAGDLIALLAPRAGSTVLDPFVGGGTVAIEARVRGHHVIGVDANPLSALVVRTKARLTSADDRDAFGVLVEALTERSFERVRERKGALAKLHGEHLGLYGTHTLKELAGLLEEIRSLDPQIDPADREAALVVFSSLVGKVSNRRADTSDEDVRKRIRKGLSTELFQRKGHELVERWAELSRMVRVRPGSLEVLTGDARALPRLLNGKAVDLVVTSPPYGGTYDYVDQHALRLDWLSLPRTHFERAEIGARRHGGEVERWDQELGDSLAAMRAVLRGPASRVALVIGDAQLGPRRLDAHEHVLALAPRVGLRPIAGASETRPDHLGGPPRREHVIVLGPR